MAPLLPQPYFRPAQEEDYWLCACGRPNLNSLSSCQNCGVSKEELFQTAQKEKMEELREQVRQRKQGEEALCREQADRYRKKQKKILISCGAGFAAILVFIGLYIGVIQPAVRYDNAISLLNEENTTRR